MDDEHLSTIPETKSDEFIKYSVENLVPTPSESEDASNESLLNQQTSIVLASKDSIDVVLDECSEDSSSLKSDYDSISPRLLAKKPPDDE
ncbi:hypothetical protein Tco_1311757 [Tanacetum coccineum]